MKNLFAKLLAALLIATLLLTPVASLAEETPAVKEAAPAADAAPADDDDEEEVLIAAEPVDEIIAEAAEESVDLIAGEADLPEEEYIDLVTDKVAVPALFTEEVQTQTYKFYTFTTYVGGGPNTGGTLVTITPWKVGQNGNYEKVTADTDIAAGTTVYFKHDYTGNPPIGSLKLIEKGGPDTDHTLRTTDATKLENSEYTFKVNMPSWDVGGVELRTVSSGPSGPSNLQPTLTAAPTAKELTYNGEEQELVNPGTVENGYMFYKLDTEPDDAWRMEIPTATEPGTYKVCYKFEGFNQVYWEESYVVTVTIAPGEATVSAPAPAPAPAAVVSTPPATSTEPVTISKAPAKVKAKAAKKGKVTVSWKKIKKTKKTKALLKQIKSIEVQLSTDPSFTTDVQTKTLGKKKTKATFKKLQKNTFYYVRVRYTDGVGGVSNWSATKKVKTKKK